MTKHLYECYEDINYGELEDEGDYEPGDCSCTEDGEDPLWFWDTEGFYECETCGDTD